MNLKEIYRPIAEEMEKVEEVLESSVKESKDTSILEMSEFLLRSPGKRTRSALVILSGKASSVGNSGCDSDELITIAAAVELIHTASLIHDDVLDEAMMRHNKPSVNARWGNNISIAFGDYIYSKAFEMIGQCKNPDVFACISEAMYAMGEGELIHVCQRNNLKLAKDSYMVIVRKKTASLFAASCQAGTILGGCDHIVRMSLKEFGLNFGIAFQIIDDCRDITSEEKVLGKSPGQDVVVGDMTLPLLNLLDVAGEDEKRELEKILGSKINQDGLRKIKTMFVNSQAAELTQRTALSYIKNAKRGLDKLNSSEYRKSLSDLADYIAFQYC
jgi:octaprenyl-diphosphate synthase